MTGDHPSATLATFTISATATTRRAPLFIRAVRRFLGYFNSRLFFSIGPIAQLGADTPGP